MSKDPAILFYTNDFISGTLTMTDEQRGQYILLLCLQHQKGYLSEKDMLSICKTYDEDIFSKFKQNGEGKYYNERMANEAEKRRKYSESRRLNASNPKKDSEAYAKHKENENENEDKSKYTEDFENFFDEFHRITGKAKEKKLPAFKHWGKLTKAEKILALEKITPFSKSKDNPKYLSIARTYLADKNFNDEFEPVKTGIKW